MKSGEDDHHPLSDSLEEAYRAQIEAAIQKESERRSLVSRLSPSSNWSRAKTLT